MRKLLLTNLFLIISLFVLPGFPVASNGLEDPAVRKKQEELLERLKTKGFSEDYLRRVFSDSRVSLSPEIVQKQGKGLNYTGRRFGLLTKKSLKKGRSFLLTQEPILSKIQKKYGVKAEVLVAVLRVETNFGRYVGKHLIFNTLLTMTLIENRRSAWAEEELAHLLRFCRDEEKDPLSLKGSWAGAFGIPQFIPSSYVKYGADGNGDGSIDLYNLSDALASIANYLKAFGWSQNDPVGKKEALYAYNRCDNYVEAVLTYARALSRK